MDVAIVLFTRDLRVRDNPALALACARARQVVPLFVVDPALDGAAEPGAVPGRVDRGAQGRAPQPRRGPGDPARGAGRRGDPAGRADRRAGRFRRRATSPATRRGAGAPRAGVRQAPAGARDHARATRSCRRASCARPAAVTTGSSRRTGVPGGPPPGGSRCLAPPAIRVPRGVDAGRPARRGRAVLPALAPGGERAGRELLRAWLDGPLGGIRRRPGRPGRGRDVPAERLPQVRLHVADRAGPGGAAAAGRRGVLPAAGLA